MTGEIFRFEWRYHTRQVVFPAAAVLFFFFGFSLTATGFGPDNVHINSPYSVAQSIALLSLPSLFILAAFCSNAVVRDREYGMQEIVFATPVGKMPFLTGRFGGAFAAAALAFAAAVAGMFAALFLPSQDPATIGALGPGAYLWAFIVLGLPNILVAAVTLFAVATLTRSVMASYAASVFIYVLYFAAAALTNSPLMAASAPGAASSSLASLLLDPFGMAPFFEQTRYWTSAARNTRLIGLHGAFLGNRLLWIGASLAGWAAVYRLFAFRINAKTKAAPARAVSTLPEVEARLESRPYQPVEQKPAGAGLRAWWSATRLDVRGFLTSRPFIALTLLSIGLAVSEIVADVTSGEYGSAQYATSGIVLEVIQQPLHLLGLVMLIYYGAEMVWRERTVGMKEIVDAAPVPSAAFVLSKFAALAVLVAVLVASGSAAAIGVQLVLGGEIDPGVVVGYAWFGGAPLGVFAMAVVLIYTAVPHKYVGMLVVLLLAAVMKQGEAFGLEHRLWRFGSTPSVPYSDMTGFTATSGFHGFLLHWSLVGALGLAVATVLWRRERVARSLRYAAAALAVASLASGAHVFYNTNVLNQYEPASRRLDWQATYEKEYLRFAAMPQPQIDTIEGVVDLYPGQRRYRVRAAYELLNTSATTIERVLVGVRRQASDVRLSIDGGRIAAHDRRSNHYWFQLTPPMRPGEQRRLEFDLTMRTSGFSNDDPDTAIVEGAAFIPSHFWLPTLGYRDSYSISEPFERRRRGLPSEQANPRDSGSSEGWVNLDLTISTDRGQTALTSGALVRRWEAGGRPHFRYRSDRRIPIALALSSAPYAVETTSWQGRPVELYRHRGHTGNAARILRVATDSLTHLEKSFGPYPHARLKIAEVPSHQASFGGFARPDTIYLSETRSFLIDARDSRRLDLVCRRVAHEVAHEWWGIHVSPRHAEGELVITESLTKYAELLVLEKAYGRAAGRELLEMELDMYLRGRTGQDGAEPALTEVTDQPYLYYRKGAIILNAIRHLLGEQAMNRALHRFAARHGGPDRQPLVSDLVAALQSEATVRQQALIAEWMNEVVLYDLSIASARSRVLPGGETGIVVQVRAEKGRPMDEEIDVALFDGETLVAERRVPMKNGLNDVRFVVARPVDEAVVDPWITRIDSNRFDNTADVQ